MPIDNPASARLPNVRVTRDKLAEYRQAAELEGVTFAQWARGALDKAAGATKRRNKAA